MKKIISRLLFLYLCFNSQAYSADNYQQDVHGVIERIYLNGVTGTYNLRLVGSDTCAKRSSNEYYVINISDPMAKSYYALFLAAAESKSQITIRVKTDCSASGNKEITYVLRDYI